MYLFRHLIILFSRAWRKVTNYTNKICQGPRWWRWCQTLLAPMPDLPHKVTLATSDFLNLCPTTPHTPMSPPENLLQLRNRDNLHVLFLSLPSTATQNKPDSPHLEFSTHGFSEPTLGFIPSQLAQVSWLPHSPVSKVPLPSSWGSVLGPKAHRHLGLGLVPC